MVKIPDITLPSIVGIITLILVNKVFPEKVRKDLKDGDLIRDNLIKKIFKKIMNDRALKISIIAIFTTAGLQHFNQEIKTLLLDDMFNQIVATVCNEELKGKLKIVCDVIKDHELNLHSKAIQELIVTNNLSREEKVNFLKIKLDFIINGDYPGRKRFVITCILATLITLYFSGVAGLLLFLEALYRLFQEGRISKALYEELFRVLSKRMKFLQTEFDQFDQDTF